MSTAHDALRGAAAIVGVADAASPTGELELHGRALEAAMIRAALDDAGLTLDDVDGVCHGGIATGLAEYLGIHPRFTDSTMTGGSSFEVHVEHAAAAIAAGLCDVVVGVYAATPRGDRRATRDGGGRPRHARAEPDARVGDAVRPAHADGRVRAGREPAHGRSTARRRSSSRRSRSTPASGRR